MQVFFIFFCTIQKKAVLLQRKSETEAGANPAQTRCCISQNSVIF